MEGVKVPSNALAGTGAGLPLGPMLAAGTALVGGGAAIAHAYRQRHQGPADEPLEDAVPDSSN